MSEAFVNQVTLDCLLNKELYNSQVRGKRAKQLNKEEHRFYRKRTLNLFKEMINKNSPENLFPDVKYAYDNFVNAAVNYFKTIDNSDILIIEEFKDSYKKDNSIIENEHKGLSYRILFAILGDCYKIGILKDYIISYLLSKINSKNDFIKSWINRALVHFLIQSDLNLRTTDPTEKNFISNCIKKCMIAKSTKDKTELCTAFKILLKIKIMPSESYILTFLDDEVITNDEEEALTDENNEEDIIKILDHIKIIENITNRIDKLHKDDFVNYKDDYIEILNKSTITDREKCIGILTGLYDINLKTCNLIKELIQLLEQNIDSFKILFKNIVDEKKDEIDDIKIDNPSIIEIIKLFI
jgi:hypothetical protein